jgi:tetratricopeptide (TPR) repeat protein
MISLNADDLIFLEDLCRDGDVSFVKKQTSSWSLDKQRDAQDYINVRQTVQKLLKEKASKQAFLKNLEPLNKDFFKKSDSAPRRKPIKSLWKRTAAVAAAVIVMAIGTKWYADATYCTDCIVAQFSIDKEFSLRSSEKGGSSKIDQALSFMDQKKYDEVVTLLNEKDMLIVGSNNLVLAKAYFHLGEYDKALDTYKKIPQIDETLLHEYYYGTILTYLAKGDITSAELWIDKAIDDKNLTSIHQFQVFDRALSHPLRKLTH